MKKSILFITLLLVLSLSICTRAYALLGEDLGLDLYNQIDSGLSSVQVQQYEYEMTGQGETDVGQVVGPILESRGLNCDIGSTDDIESLLGNNDSNQITNILERCGFGDEVGTPTLLIEKVQNTLGGVKNDFVEISQEKTDTLYKVARTGLYNDGNIENSPFDLMEDVKNIDAIIFTQEIEYNPGEDLEDFQKRLEKYMNKKESNAQEETLDQDEEDDDSDSPENNEENDNDDSDISEDEYGHQYVCAPENTSGLNIKDFLSVKKQIEGGKIGANIKYYSDDTYSSGRSWGGPFPGGSGSQVSYDPINDEWGCNPSDYFCIVVEFETSQYGLIGGETLSIEKIISRASEHLEKSANTSLTQHKMTTNNFELGAVINNLPGMLRGFGIEVSSRPVPILDLESSSQTEKNGNILAAENLLRNFYKNNGLDFERANDLSMFGSLSGNIPSENEEKILQSSGDMSITYSQSRMNELKKLSSAMRGNNSFLDHAIGNQVQYDDMKDFAQRFSEIERFVSAIEEFVENFTGHINTLEKIPQKGA